MAAEGESDFQKAVAWAMTSPVGVGSAQFHTGGGAGPALSVYLGVYRRSAVLAAGGWDEAMLVAEDWELNYRIRSADGLIWFDPSLRVTYRPRASLKALGIQYFRYGRWRRVVARQYPDTVSVRYLAPPIAAALFAFGLVLGVVGLAAGLPWLALGFVLPGGYLLAVILAGLGLPKSVSTGVRLRSRWSSPRCTCAGAADSSPAPSDWPAPPAPGCQARGLRSRRAALTQRCP